jgi:hypothetical protein
MMAHSSIKRGPWPVRDITLEFIYETTPLEVLYAALMFRITDVRRRVGEPG